MLTFNSNDPIENNKSESMQLFRTKTHKTLLPHFQYRQGETKTSECKAPYEL